MRRAFPSRAFARPSRALPWLGLALAGPACLLGSSINHPPDLTLTPPSSVTAGAPATYYAQAHDPDGNRVSFAWWEQPGPCGAPPTSADLAKLSFTDQASHTVTPVRDQDLCLGVQARDAEGAASEPRQVTVHAGNSAPRSGLTLLAPNQNALERWPLYTTFQLSAAVSTDPERDPLTRQWTLQASDDRVTAQLVPCGPPDARDLVMCLHVTSPAVYLVTLTVSDGELTSEPATMSFTVASDSPPCLVDLLQRPSRSVADPAAPLSFAVAVQDDGDPFPQGGENAPVSSASPTATFPTFAWSVRTSPDQPWQVVSTQPSLTFGSGTFATGDSLSVKVDVRDRVARVDECSADVACRAGCPPDGSCPESCYQRLVWSVELR